MPIWPSGCCGFVPCADEALARPRAVNNWPTCRSEPTFAPAGTTGNIRPSRTLGVARARALARGEIPPLEVAPIAQKGWAGHGIFASRQVDKGIVSSRTSRTAACSRRGHRHRRELAIGAMVDGIARSGALAATADRAFNSVPMAPAVLRGLRCRGCGYPTCPTPPACHVRHVNSAAARRARAPRGIRLPVACRVATPRRSRSGTCIRVRARTRRAGAGAGRG